MKRSFSLQAAFEAFLAATHGSSIPSLSLGEMEQSHSTQAHGDLAEGFGSNWESAWIDLGGEG